MKTTNTHPRNLARVIVGIFLAACLFGFLGILATGCKSRVPDVAASQLDYERTAPDGTKIKIKLWSPREVEIGSATVNPATGVFAMTNYNASPNAAALRAQVDERREIREMMREGMETTRTALQSAVTAFTGRDARGSPAATRLAPEDLAQIAALLRGATATNAPASTNAPLR